MTVSPPSATLNQGDKISLAASVNADAGITDRTVTWLSSNTAIASVDANGLVTAGTTAGTATVTASSKVDPTVKGAALITVLGTGTSGALATVTIASINQTTCGIAGCASAPANLANVVGQVDVTLNVDPGAQKLAGVDLLLNCPVSAGGTGTDVVVATQNLATADVAPLAVEAASAPITLSFNSAAFTNGTANFRNGACTLKARARIVGSATTVATAATPITLNNPDVIIGTLSATKANRINPLTGLSWNGGDVTVSVTPVFFTTGRTTSTVNITYEGRTITGLTVPTTGASAGTVSAVFLDKNDPAALADATLAKDDIDQITDANSQNTVVVSVIDNSGNSFSNAANAGASTPLVAGGLATQSSFLASPAFPSGIAQFRLDTRKPASGTLNIANNAEQNTGPIGYLTSSFRFVGDSAAGYRGADALGTGGNAGAVCGGVAYTVTRTSNCDFGGVDSVTVVFEVGSSATATTWTRVTNPSTLSESNTNTANTLRQITTDRLGNADTTFVCSIAAATANPASANGSAGQCTEFSSGTRSGGERFGVDKTAPTQAFTAGEANQATFTNAATPGSYFLTITDNLSGNGTYAGAGSVLVAQTRQTGRTYTAGAIAGFENAVYSNNAGAARPGSADVFVAGYNVDNTPCLIGRFNASASNAGPNALTALSASGGTLGFCTPVPYNPSAGGPAGTSGIPAGNAVGYIRTEIVPSDQAGNSGTPFLSTIYVDPNAPVIQNVDAPGTIAGGATVAFPVAATDTGTVSNSVNSAGDITGAIARVNYTAGGANAVPASGPTGGLTLQYPADNTVGVAFDNVLTRTATANPTVAGFIKTLNVSAGGTTAPTATASPNAASVTFFVNDAVPQYSGAFTSNLSTVAGAAPTQITGTNTVYSSGTVTRTFTGGFVASENNATVQNCPAAGCTAGTATTTNTSTTITATASGATGTFTNPFSTVQVWYRQSGTADAYTLAGTATVLGTQDNGTTRTWQYNFTFDPPATSPNSPEAPNGRNLTVNGSGVEYFVVGVNSNGDAVATPSRVITIANP